MPDVYWDLTEAMREPECPACTVAARYEKRHLDHLLYEYANDPGAHKAFRAGLGWCSHHAALAAGAQDALGVAILHEGLLAYLLPQLAELCESGAQTWLGRKRHRRGLASTAPCTVCAAQAEWEQMALRTLLQQLAQPEFAAAFRQTPGLCLPHLSAAMDLDGDAAGSRILLDIEYANFSELHARLERFVQLHDYRFQGAELAAVGDAWRRALNKISGRRRRL